MAQISDAFSRNFLAAMQGGAQPSPFAAYGGGPAPAPGYNALAAYGGPTRAAAGAMGAQGASPADWLVYDNQGAIRSLPLSEKLVGALGFLPELGVQMHVFSGGQSEKGSGGPRTGSTRHDHGDAADVFFYKDGRKLDWANPADVPIFTEIVRRAKANGVTGFGAGEGYMRPGSMHIGFGNEAVWGAGGSGANAANWLRAAVSGQPVPQRPAPQQPAPGPLDNLFSLLGI